MPSICLDNAYRGEKILSAFRSAFESYNKIQTSYQWRLKQEEYSDDICVRKGAVEIQKKIKIVARLFEKEVHWWFGAGWQSVSLEISVEINPKAWNVSQVYWRIDVSFLSDPLLNRFLNSQMYKDLIRNFVCALSEND